ncbi:MAG: hypothetical protein WBF33_00575 [Candidatus Nitrosopolaris sp.]
MYETFLLPYYWTLDYSYAVVYSTNELQQANVYDNQIYPAITSSLPQGVRYVAADSSYDDYKLYNLSIDRGFELVCPVSEIYK